MFHQAWNRIAILAVISLRKQERNMLTAGVMWLFGVPLVAVVLIYFLILRKR
ncbi:hypothetical protein CES85_4173 [Ochrobactrum quorumnocens]|uniref:Uncharacterized protein n=1 Tax=Ochrobactrum quorumnocens TaxID=271865 RepID=A0A248U9D7_9HYPH|nr:hypothetical protein CES85_4173 [[Ochrobactrum] quorumnocens]